MAPWALPCFLAFVGCAAKAPNAATSHVFQGEELRAEVVRAKVGVRRATELTGPEPEPASAATSTINISGSSGEAALKRWWADGRHYTTMDAFEHGTITDHSTKYAAIVFGMVRTWPVARKMFQRTFLGGNSPMDLFFEIYAQDEVHVDLIASTVLRLPRRRVHVERFGAPVMDQLRQDHRMNVCTIKPKTHKICVEADTRPPKRLKINLALLSKSRKIELGWRMMQAHVAADRGGVEYDAVLIARMDMGYPPQPFDMAKAAAADALLIPAGADMPINDQLAVGRPKWLEAYATAYSYCATSAVAKRMYDKNLAVISHPCSRLSASLVPAIRNRVPDEHFRRFWFQMWILRGDQLNYFEQHNNFVYRTFNSPCCWQHLNWEQPSRSLSVLVDLNTTCQVNPSELAKHDTKSSVPWPKGSSIDLLKCRYAGSFCNFKKYKSSCKTLKGPPPGPDYHLPGELPVGVYEIPQEANYASP